MVLTLVHCKFSRPLSWPRKDPVVHDYPESVKYDNLVQSRQGGTNYIVG